MYITGQVVKNTNNPLPSSINHNRLIESFIITNMGYSEIPPRGQESRSRTRHCRVLDSEPWPRDGISLFRTSTCI